MTTSTYNIKKTSSRKLIPAQKGTVLRHNVPANDVKSVLTKLAEGDQLDGFVYYAVEKDRAHFFDHVYVVGEGLVPIQ